MKVMPKETLSVSYLTLLPPLLEFP